MPSKKEKHRSYSRKAHDSEGEKEGNRYHDRSREGQELGRSGPHERKRERDAGHEYHQDNHHQRMRRTRSRSRSQSPQRRKRREPTPSDSEDELLDLRKLGVSEIGEDDYFLKASEFRLWLKKERGKYLDQISSEAAHKYFRRFVRRWNDGALPSYCYSAPDSTALPLSANTSYKWTFAANHSRVDSNQLAAARADVDRLTHAKTSLTQDAPLGNYSDSDDDVIGPRLDSSISGSNRRLGPSLPSASERQMDREEIIEAEREKKALENKKSRKALYERAEEAVPRSSGREGRVEERRAANEQNRQFRESDPSAGLEIEENMLMGDNEGFSAALRARQSATSRKAERRLEAAAEERLALEEKLAERRTKETATMDMLKALAKQRFG